MRIKIKSTLTKSRNPTEHNIKLENKSGELIQVVGDGYCLIKSDDLTIKKTIIVNKRRIYEDVPLEWYIHEQDFYIPQRLTR